MVWTNFTDMYSGGSNKLGYEEIWIEAEVEKAVSVFMEVFGVDPDNVTCSCCGADFWYWKAEPDIKDGDAVVSAEDIRKLESSLEPDQ